MYFVQDSFGKPEIKKFCYHMTCDLSCAYWEQHNYVIDVKKCHVE